MPTWTIGYKWATGVFNSKPGGIEETFAIIKTTRGKNTRLEEYPSRDMALRMYQTHKTDMRRSCKKDSGTTLRVVAVRRFADNTDMNWNNELMTTIKSIHITPYSSSYSYRMKKLRGF